MLGAVRVLNNAASKTFFVCEDGEGQFHHGKATNWIYVVSLSGISLAGLLTFLVVMHLNVGYNNNIFLCHAGQECVRKQPSYMSSSSYFAALFRIFIIPRYMSWVFSNILS